MSNAIEALLVFRTAEYRNAIRILSRRSSPTDNKAQALRAKARHLIAHDRLLTKNPKGI